MNTINFSFMAYDDLKSNGFLLPVQVKLIINAEPDGANMCISDCEVDVLIRVLVTNNGRIV